MADPRTSSSPPPSSPRGAQMRSEVPSTVPQMRGGGVAQLVTLVAATTQPRASHAALSPTFTPFASEARALPASSASFPGKRFSGGGEPHRHAAAQVSPQPKTAWLFPPRILAPDGRWGPRPRVSQPSAYPAGSLPSQTTHAHPSPGQPRPGTAAAGSMFLAGRARRWPIGSRPSDRCGLDSGSRSRSRPRRRRRSCP